MKRRIEWTALAMTLALTVLGHAHDVDSSASSPVAVTQEDDTADIEAWPENTQITARGLISKYGPPDAVTNQRLIWNNRDPWSQITVLRDGVSDDFPTTHLNIVENTIHYNVPHEKSGEIAKFNSAVIVNRKTGTLSARSDGEEANILALNLADEIARGKRDVREARVFMRDTLRKSMAGKSSPYMDHLLFTGKEPRTSED